jgi:Helicase HerA, central domain
MNVAAAGVEYGGKRALFDLELAQGALLGHVCRLDPSRIEVELLGSDLAACATVADMVALPVGDGSFLIGLVGAVSGGPGSTDAGLQRGSLTVMPAGTIRSDNGSNNWVFRRGASVYPHVGGNCHLVEGETLRQVMTILAGEVAPGERLALGHYVADHGSPAIADGNHMFQRHAALLGSTGTGKSWAVALMVERAAALGHANLVVFDLHGEYWPLTEGVDGRKPVARGLRVAGPADRGSNSDDLLHLPYWLFERDELMTVVQDPTDPHAADQLFRFSEHVLTLKEISLRDAGRPEAVATFTVDSPIPYKLGHLVQMLKQDDTEKIPRHPGNHLDPGPFAGRLTGLISRLEARAADPRYAFIFDPPDSTLTYDWLAITARKLLNAGPASAGIKIIDLSEVPSAIVPMVAGVLARFVYGIQFWMKPNQRTPVCLVCDEAHLYLPPAEDASPIHRVALQAFEAIAKEGRKHGVALVVVSQRPTDVSRTILSQCHNFVIMRVTNDYDRGMIERLIPETLAGVTNVLPVLDVGEAVVIGDALLLPTRIKLDRPTFAPASDTQPFWTLWAQQASSHEAISAGTEALRNQYRQG